MVFDGSLGDFAHCLESVGDLPLLRMGFFDILLILRVDPFGTILSERHQVFQLICYDVIVDLRIIIIQAVTSTSRQERTRVLVLIRESSKNKRRARRVMRKKETTINLQKHNVVRIKETNQHVGGRRTQGGSRALVHNPAKIAHIPEESYDRE